MSKHTVTKLPKNTIEIVLDIPWSAIQAEYTKSFDALSQTLEVEGFRKGKAPKAIAEKHIAKDSIYNHLVRSLLPDEYEAIVKKENLKPILSPHIELVKAKENEDWQFKLTVAEKPTIELKNYKEVIKKSNAKNKKSDIWVPGQDEAKKASKEQEQQAALNNTLSELMKSTTVEISDLILEEEMNQRLSKIVDDVQKLGLTLETYLKSKGTTLDEVKKNLKQEISETYKLEFLLAEIAEKENITVEQKDIEALFTNITDPKERKAAEQNAYFYATILRKQKVLEFLSSL